MTLNTPEMAKHLRKRFKAEGIACRCKKAGAKEIIVSVPAYGIEFSEDEQRKIRFIAKCNKLTSVRGLEIDIERMTDPHQIHFFLP